MPFIYRIRDNCHFASDSLFRAIFVTSDNFEFMSKPKSTRKASTKIKSIVWSSKEDSALLTSAKVASSKAIRSSRALGITIKIIRNQELIEISPDKSEKVLRKISKSSVDLSDLKKGMILERK